MNLGVIGTGFVGLVTGSCLANKIHKVTCIDMNKRKINQLKKRNVPIYERGLQNLIDTKINKYLFFENDFRNINQHDLIFITVGTPLIKGKVSLSYIEKSIFSILKFYNRKKKILIVLKSTIPPGTTKYLNDKYIKKYKNLSLINNPEFLREGSAVEDFLNPDRIIIGYQNTVNLNKIIKLYSKYKCPKFKLSWTESEIAKYYSNTFFSLLISFANQYSYICDSLPNADLNNINKTLLADRRISNSKKTPDLKNYLIPGVGFGGSCFPKDVGGIKEIFFKKKLKTNIFNAILDINKNSIDHSLNIIKKKFKKDATICILGASFKENTNDVRESRTLNIIDGLKKSRYKIIVIDPIVKSINGIKCKKFSLKNIYKYKNFILMTRWSEFSKLREIKFKKEVTIIDLRRFFSKSEFKSDKIKLISIGKGSLI